MQVLDVRLKLCRSLATTRANQIVYERYRKPFSVIPFSFSSLSNCLLRLSRCNFIAYNNNVADPAQEVVIAYEKRYVGPQPEGQTYL